MNTVSDRNFGILIAYLVPGFTALLGVSYFSNTVKTWLTGASPGGPTIGGFLYVTIASVAAGMTCSAIRFHIIDRIHAWTGITHPAWDFSKLADRVAAYDTLIEIHYNYYKFHANGLVALVIFYIARPPIRTSFPAKAACVTPGGAGSPKTTREEELFLGRHLFLLSSRDFFVGSSDGFTPR